jgi:hypothetical protein
MAAGIAIEKIEVAIVVHPVRPAPWGVSIREQKKGLFNALLYKKHPHLYKEKIGAKPLWNYYSMITLALLAVVFILVQWWVAAGITAALWTGLVVHFAYKRLRQTNKQPTHVLEMLYTSAVIPFYSVYWTLYGSIRFKKWLF